MTVEQGRFLFVGAPVGEAKGEGKSGEQSVPSPRNRFALRAVEESLV